jgi:hypothetical protein
MFIKIKIKELDKELNIEYNKTILNNLFQSFFLLRRAKGNI